MNTAASPCRLFVHLARDAPVGVVLRRGPSGWARLSLWRTDTDELTHGQWLKGRVYERRSDLAADGGLFVAFVRQLGRRRGPGRDTWVAVSRPPWFTALALWFVGGTYCAGGFFPAERTLWLPFAAAPPDVGEVPDWLRIVTWPPPHLDRTPNWTERTVHHNRLLRDGWRRVEGARLETWAHPHPAGGMTLLMTEHSDRDFGAYGGPHVVEYAVEVDAEDEFIPLGRATWADWDQRGRLVLARAGRLVAWEGPTAVRVIADFNGMVPEPEAAPEWARRWPE